ncbi:MULTISPECIES: IS6-like element ISHmu9 family transposase [Halomicrobium]|uniref:IS240-type transposase (ISH102) n=2 Tax=Halomicrobium mukohataei TaxID=57705 RepID=C7NVU5_HALMD|nr:MULTISPECIES: IS6-like element ISHmu9 family transposase [Halomicrobium]ACV46210.1 IS240-type transposase (ISH102) [Halomicrobium mukohataei DSM 12286]QCD64774.1 IS6-like element ISHmu9 family transposase [Halomicrobium mukohataei]QFR19581.1 IS6-like element ISHmu9 family transposase [Halomicrobium sp. ZPS1]
MPENDRLIGNLDEINLELVEREATPRFLMKFSIQLYLAGLSLSNTVSALEIVGVERARSTVHNWVHKAELQPESGRSPDQIAVDETVIRIDDEQYWLYAAVDPDSNELLYTQLETTRTTAISHAFSAELREKHHVDDAVFLVDGATPLEDACSRYRLDFRYQKHGTRNGVERIFRVVKRRTSSSSNRFSHVDPDTADDWLRTFSFA